MMVMGPILGRILVKRLGGFLKNYGGILSWIRLMRPNLKTELLPKLHRRSESVKYFKPSLYLTFPKSVSPAPYQNYSDTSA